MNDLKITIVNLFDEGYIDLSGFHIACISFYINNKLFNYCDYIDPLCNKIVRNIIKPGKAIKGNERESILSELSVKLHIHFSDSKELLSSVLEQADNFIETTPEVRKKFPTLIDLSQEAMSWGFILLSFRPFHAMIMSSKGIESHIYSRSIQYVKSEIESYAQHGEVHENYHFWRIQDLCRFNYHMYFERHPHLHGWVIYYRSKEAGKYNWQHVSTLRDLENEIIKRKALSPEDL